MRKFTVEWVADVKGDEQIYQTAFGGATFEKAFEVGKFNSSHAGWIDWFRVQEWEWVGPEKTGHWDEVARHACTSEGVEETTYA